LAINIAKRFNFSGQAVSLRGLSFAFFQFCSLFGSSALLTTPNASTQAEPFAPFAHSFFI
jgi:endonuclease V-like protein UPF0215 family